MGSDPFSSLGGDREVPGEDEVAGDEDSLREVEANLDGKGLGLEISVDVSV